MIKSIAVGDKIKPNCSSSYAEIYNIFEYKGVKYVAYMWHNEDGSQSVAIPDSKYFSSHVSELEDYLSIIGKGSHHKI
ncbi:hypothetical protein CON39_11815 [Bacillus thuringiensis]|uniref:hypothetical protein n=1 Tax=Bacillus thuringiensis TaxID=1428 RepID=UPI000BEE418D|nr:hypothetical protein [Bacillus thuringiensis]PEF30352.1 hypothetical protein CON39_11815 [Bacillus thuringiensis]